MYYWETKEMCGYETKLHAALRQIYLHANDGEDVVLKYDAEVDRENAKHYYWEAGGKSGVCDTSDKAYENILKYDDDSREPVLEEMSEYEFWRWMNPA